MQKHTQIHTHSSGAQYVGIFAGRFPEQVAGVVLLDLRDEFAELPTALQQARSIQTLATDRLSS